MTTRPRIGDPIVNEWFPVIAAADVLPGSMHPFRLLGQRLVLLGVDDDDGAVTVVSDTCPHRGARLSLGTFDGRRLQCPYHGWVFAADGACVHRPAHPDTPVTDGCSLVRVHARSAFGLWWVCLGDSPRAVPGYDAFDQHPGLTITLGPKRLAACGPRIIENFLDTAHFPFVHAGYLGEVPHTAYRDHGLHVSETGVVATDVMVWQPNPGPTATAGGDVHYTYAVDHPYAAMLTKVPSQADGGELGGFSLMLVASPSDEDDCQVWMLTTVFDPDADLASFDSFNQTIFGQDVDIVESQEPKRLPLDPRAEVHQRADRVSLAYRRWLLERGIAFGTSAND